MFFRSYSNNCMKRTNMSIAKLGIDIESVHKLLVSTVFLSTKYQLQFHSIFSTESSLSRHLYDYVCCIHEFSYSTFHIILSRCLFTHTHTHTVLLLSQAQSCRQTQSHEHTLPVAFPLSFSSSWGLVSSLHT